MIIWPANGAGVFRSKDPARQRVSGNSGPVPRLTRAVRVRSSRLLPKAMRVVHQDLSSE